MIELSNCEYRIYSQNGEDGIIETIFDTIGNDSLFYVEFGAHDGSFCSNTKYLREHLGWRGLLLDGDHEDLSLHLHKEWITAENINSLFEKYDVPRDLDFLCIDLDYNDFYIWNALNEKYLPRVVMIEYNASLGAVEDKVVKYLPHYLWDGTNYFGASIKALYQLGRKKGYSLVYAEKMGGNLFFVRDDLSQRFEHRNQYEAIFRAPQYGVGGHPQDPFSRPYISSHHLLG